MGTPVRFNHGVTTSSRQGVLFNFPLPDPFRTSLGGSGGKQIAAFETDYYSVGAAITDYILVGLSSTFAAGAAAGGVAVITPGAATTVSTLSGPAANHALVSGSKFWYQTRLKLALVGAGIIAYAGLQNGAGATNTDGLFFAKTTGAADVWTLINRVGSANTTLWTDTGNPSVADTYVDLGFYYDGTDVHVYKNGAEVAIASAPTLTAVALSYFYQITPTATDVMTVDYLLVAGEVTR